MAAEPELAGDGVDLGAVKTYAAHHGAAMQEATTELLATAQAYYDLVKQMKSDTPEDPYTLLWTLHPEEATELLQAAKDQWLAAITAYELNEGIVAGVPSLAYYDVWIDAGPPATESQEEALEWEFNLPNGETLQSPGNFFDNLLEPTLWATRPQSVVARVDLDGDGEITAGEALPNADLLLVSAQGLDNATAEMNAAILEWDPTQEDAYTALVVMIPTMNAYFEQWKESKYILLPAARVDRRTGRRCRQRPCCACIRVGRTIVRLLCHDRSRPC